MIIKTSSTEDIQPYLKNLFIPEADSHKGMNGKGLIIGGSTLFHSASLWAAEVASHFLDMVHYSSTQENNEIFQNIKSEFRNGIVVHQKDLLHYVKEDDAILIGPGMVREGDEAEYTYNITKELLQKFPNKRFVIDAGALQMMKPEWLQDLKQKAIITPHLGEFQRMFGEDLSGLSLDQKVEKVQSTAKEFNCIILLKAIQDIISDGEQTVIVEGGNAGLTKGGSGDILAGLTMSFYTKTDPFSSAILASYLEKRTADALLQNKSYWYNMENLIDKVPEILATIIKK